MTAADAAASYAQVNAPAPQATYAPGQPVGGEFEKSDGTLGYDENINPIQTVERKTFLLQNGVWTDTTFQTDTMQTEKVEFLSDVYFALLDAHPEIAPYLAIGERLIVLLDGTAYEITSAV